MTVKELMSNLSNVNPDAEVVLVDVDFNSYTIEEHEDFGDGEEVTIYIAQ